MSPEKQRRGYRRERSAAVEAVSRGLELALSRDGASEIRSKGGLDIVTAADVAVEEAMRLVLRAATKFPVVGEEGGDNAETNATYLRGDPIFVIRDFASGVPVCVH